MVVTLNPPTITSETYQNVASERDERDTFSYQKKCGEDIFSEFKTTTWPLPFHKSNLEIYTQSISTKFIYLVLHF